jgi:hypothetical protein
MTSIEREGGRGKGEGSLWDQTVDAVVAGFEHAFDVKARGLATLPLDAVP